jgi:hypothetical protein
LFSADGQAVYLSLNQGTSEFRSGAMRPILRDDGLLNSAAVGRTILADIDSPIISTALQTFDLKAGEPM